MAVPRGIVYVKQPFEASGTQVPEVHDEQGESKVMGNLHNSGIAVLGGAGFGSVVEAFGAHWTSIVHLPRVVMSARVISLV